ncbi:MAG: HAD-IA family hydrolase [Chitinophagaceae bacterium]|jgi:putative hydrolase of the HAD superfamily|nr:HAD-IA family hydrolase [Chitinophagaceae bacterium]OQY95788.1 MAG: hydrolase [Sphingobacteriales bacterium UTBCD1]
MAVKIPINTIFTDIGGVLLTNGWDHTGRKKAVELFKLDPEETEDRHHLTFGTYEIGKITLDEYLRRVVFYKKRSFSTLQFRQFMYKQSQPLPGTLELLKQLKKKYKLKIAVLSNEGRELAEYRIKQYQLGKLADFFIVSSFVHFRKPDTDIFKIALDTAQVFPEQVIYIEDRPMFVQVASRMGINGIVHTNEKNTAEKLKDMGLK